MIRSLLAFTLILGMSGCCAFCKSRVKPPITIIETERGCLDGMRTAPLMPLVTQATENCPKKYACYDAPNSVALGRWILEAAEWMRDAVTRCATRKDSDETSSD